MILTSTIGTARIGLRAYDITLGFRNLDERSAALSDFSHTHTAGMAALLTGAIKGREIIRDARALKKIAADVLKINPWAFDKVVNELGELELVREIRCRDGEVISFVEQVPLLHDDVHARLGDRWVNSHPSEIEQMMVAAVDTLAHTPLPREQLRAAISADDRADEILRGVGQAAELIRLYRLQDGTEVVASPLYAFEQPDTLVPLFEQHPADRVRESFGRIREQPGLPVLMDGSDPIAEDMVRLGLVPAPTVVGADKRSRAFIVLPYGLDAAYLTSKKQVLERALALIACVRCGEISGGVTPVRFPDRLLAALMDPDRDYSLSGHSSTMRQYALLIQLGMIHVVDRNSLPAARLRPTEDNLEAVDLARTLLRRQGEALPERGNESEAARLLFTGEDYLAPIETIALSRRNSPALTSAEIEGLWGRVVESF